MKIYLAAKFGDKMLMREHRERLQAAGHEVTSQWIDVEHQEDSSHTVTDEDRVRFAQMDLDDVRRAHVLVAFSSPRSEPNIGGGRHVEFGYAACLNKTIIVVGPKGEHIFHYLPCVRGFCDTVTDLIAYLNGAATLDGDACTMIDTPWKLSFHTLREANVTRQNTEWDVDNRISLSYRGNELAGEVGEACNVIKKLEREMLGIKGSRDTKEHLAEELADVIVCVDLIAAAMGIDLADAVRAKFNATSNKNGFKTHISAGDCVVTS